MQERFRPRAEAGCNLEACSRVFIPEPMMVLERTRGHEVSEAGRLGELYERHAPEGVRLAFLLTGNRALAEDLVHEAFIRMFGRFRDLRRPESFHWYLRRTIVNLARSHFRHAKVERTHLEREKGWADGSRADRGGPDPGAREELWEALLRLPVRQRAAIVLRFYEDLSEAQTAEALGCPIGTVKSLVSRGVSRLREEMSTDG